MNTLRQAAAMAVILGFVYMAAPGPAHAYLDPGTGSYVFQILIAGIVGGLFALKLFWKQVKAFFVRIFSRKDSDDRTKE